MRQTETGIWLFHSHLSEQDAAEHTAALVQQIKKISLHTEIGRSVDYNVSFPTDVVKDPLPAICIINGVGTCGKGTFCKLASKYSSTEAIELSAIDPVREAANDLLIYSHNNASVYGDSMTARTIIDEKGDMYRQFLHEIKMSWERLYQGSTMYGIGKIFDIISNGICISVSKPERCYDYQYATGFLNKSLYSAYKITNFDSGYEEYRNWMNHTNVCNPFVDHMTVETKLPTIIFINIREPENIRKFQRECFKLGLLCFTLLIDGRVPDDFLKNDADSQVHNMTYDVTIENKYDIDSLSTSAFIFTKFVERANKLYGVSTRSMVETVLTGYPPMDDVPEEPASK